MMEPPGGTALVEESIVEALDFRRAMRKVDEEFGKDWWFKVWGPERLAEEGIGKRDDWMLHANERWHGFGNLAPGFNMLDPIKATVITPGPGRVGQVRRRPGIPASIVTRYLAEHGVIVEKTGLYSFFIMFTIGITKGRWNTLVTALQQFKDDYDKNQPLWRDPARVRAGASALRADGPARPLRADPRHVQGERRGAASRPRCTCRDMQPAMKPSDAFARMAHREIDRVEIDELEGRVTSVLLTPYPPGIPLLIPGERFNRRSSSTCKFARDFQRAVPRLRHRHPRPRRGDGRQRQDPLLHGLRAAEVARFPPAGWKEHMTSDGVFGLQIAPIASLARRQSVGAQSARTGCERNRRTVVAAVRGRCGDFRRGDRPCRLCDGRAPRTSRVDGAHRVHRCGRHLVSARRAHRRS